jgi:hypothetical protein
MIEAIDVHIKQNIFVKQKDKILQPPYNQNNMPSQSCNIDCLTHG